MKTLFQATVGSRAYNLHNENSDWDKKGVYQQHNDDILSFRYKEQIEYSKDHTEYEVRRFLELLKSANPTVLELLWSPPDCILHKDPAFDLILEHRDKFLTKNCRNSFGGYAHAQICKAKGLGKKFNWEKDRVEKREPIDFCYIIRDDKTYKCLDWLSDKKWVKTPRNIGLVKLNHAPNCYAVYLHDTERFNGIFEKNSSNIITSSVEEGALVWGIFVYNKDDYQRHLKDWESYSIWLKERNETRYVENKESGQKIDGKNMLHARRLLNMAMEIPVEKTLNVRREDREKLLTIRRGKINLGELIEEAETDLKKLDDLYKNCDLPDRVNDDFLNDLLLEIRKSY